MDRGSVDADQGGAEVLVQGQDLTVRYHGVPVLDGVSLEIQAGEFVGIVGPNGAGKSTLLGALLGTTEPTEGQVWLCGERADRFSQHERIGYVPQHAVNVDPRFPASALEVALLGRVARRGLLRRWNQTDRDRARAALDRVGVAHLADRRIGTLSGGERQRVFLAKALASEPDLLVLDEPTTGVDPRAREAFYNLVDGLNHLDGTTVVLVSHDLQAVQLCCHRLVALNQRIVYDGPPGGFEDAGGLSRAYDMHVHHHAHERGGP